MSAPEKNSSSEETAEQLKNLLINAIKSESAERLYLAKGLINKAYDYTGYRVRFSYSSFEEKAEIDGKRTSCHNAYMDSLNMFLRYEKKLGNDVPDVEGLDRKTIGDIGNLLIAKLAIDQR